MTWKKLKNLNWNLEIKIVSDFWFCVLTFESISKYILKGHGTPCFSTG